MVVSITVGVTRKRGLRRLYVGVRLAPEAIAQIDMIAGAEDLSRSDVLRRWVRAGLDKDYRRLFGS